MVEGQFGLHTIKSIAIIKSNLLKQFLRSISTLKKNLLVLLLSNQEDFDSTPNIFTEACFTSYKIKV